MKQIVLINRDETSRMKLKRCKIQDVAYQDEKLRMLQIGAVKSNLASEQTYQMIPTLLEDIFSPSALLSFINVCRRSKIRQSNSKKVEVSLDFISFMLCIANKKGKKCPDQIEYQKKKNSITRQAQGSYGTKVLYPGR